MNPAETLTTREREVLDLLYAGHATHDVSRILDITNTTTRNHVGKILLKLGARTRIEAMAVARRLGLVGDTPAEPPPPVEHHLTVTVRVEVIGPTPPDR